MRIYDIINITESFDSRFSNLKWDRQGTVIFGIGEINKEKFVLEIGLQSLSIGKITYKYVTTEFYKIVNGVPTQKLTGQNSKQSVIFGCIKNAFHDKIKLLDKQFGIDAIVTLVKTDDDNKPAKRIGLYKNMFSKIHGNTKWEWAHDFRFDNLIGSIFTKNQINADTLDQLKKSIGLRGKINM